MDFCAWFARAMVAVRKGTDAMWVQPDGLEKGDLQPAIERKWRQCSVIFANAYAVFVSFPAFPCQLCRLSHQSILFNIFVKGIGTKSRFWKVHLLTPWGVMLVDQQATTKERFLMAWPNCLSSAVELILGKRTCLPRLRRHFLSTRFLGRSG